MPDTRTNADAPLSAAAALALVTDQQRVFQLRRGGYVWAITGVWGVAWLLGFLAIWTIDGTRPTFTLAPVIAWTIFAVLFAGAVAVSAILGIRSGRGIRSNSANSFTGIVYGVSWAASMVSINVFGAALLANGMSRHLADLFFPSAYTLVIGILYLAAAAIWRVVPMIIAGGWFIVVAVATPFVGYPLNYLVFAIAGGGLFLTLAAVAVARRPAVVAASNG
jgi:hypothetical protein